MKLSTRVQHSKHERPSYTHRFLVTVDRGPKADYSNVSVHDVEVSLSFRLTARCSVINAWIANRLAWLAIIDAVGEDDELLIWQLTLDGRPYNFLSRKCWEYLGMEPSLSVELEERILRELLVNRAKHSAQKPTQEDTNEPVSGIEETSRTKRSKPQKTFQLKIFRG